MDQLKIFFAYPFIVLNWATTTWWCLFRQHWGWSALANLVAFAISVFLHQEITKRWPILEDFLGNPMNAVWGFTIYGVLGMVGLSIVTLVGLLIAAPSQIYREQLNKIKSLVPSPLRLAFDISKCYVTAKKLELNSMTLTNQSQQNMSLTFVMSLNYICDGGTTGHAKIKGNWHDEERSSQDGEPGLSMMRESVARGTLVFVFPESQDMGLMEWVSQFKGKSQLDGCTLEVRDTVSDVTAKYTPSEHLVS